MLQDTTSGPTQRLDLLLHHDHAEREYAYGREPLQGGAQMDLPSFPHVDLFAAGVNALYGALVARTPSHNRGYTVAGLLIMAFFGGIGGGIARDVLLNVIPGPFLDPTFLVVCLLMGILGLVIYHYSAARGERFRTRTLAFVKSFTLPWFAILGVHKALEADLGIFAAVVIGLIATTAGGVVIDLFSGVTPEVVKPAEQLVTTAVIAGLVYAVLAKSGLAFFPVTLIAVLAGFAFRVFAVREHWSGIVPQEVAEPSPIVVTGATASDAGVGDPGAPR
jgi:uncharacterized membrane protein YeiH